MHTLTLFWYFLALLCGVAYLRYQMHEWIHVAVSSSTVAHCETKMHLESWRRKNPHVFPAHSEEGRTLVIHAIHAYEDFLYLHHFVDDDGYLDELYAMLIDWNPTPPGKHMKPLDPSQLAPASCVLLKWLSLFRLYLCEKEKILYVHRMRTFA